MAKKVAVVTGSSKGLGFAVVKGLCQQFNGIVYLTARDERRGIEAVKILEEIGLKPKFHQLDVSDESSVERFANFLNLEHGGLDVLVNNAAIMDLGQVYTDYEGAKKNIDINYRSLLTIEKHFFPLLRDGARVVNVSSACGHLSNLRNLKWLERLQDKNLTTEQVNHWNISINAVHPGHMKTDMAKGGGISDPDDAAKVILYLILDASSNLKGTFMWCDRKLVDWTDVDGDYYYKCEF